MSQGLFTCSKLCPEYFLPDICLACSLLLPGLLQLDLWTLSVKQHRLHRPIPLFSSPFLALQLCWHITHLLLRACLLYLHACMLSCSSQVLLFLTQWIVAHQAPLCMGILQVRILEWVAISSSRGSSPPRIKPASHMSPTVVGRFFFYH